VNDVTRWTQIKVIFDRASQVSSAQREQLLRDSCGSDPELRRELDSLLATYDADTGFLDTPALTGAAYLIEAEVPDAQLGRQIGNYLIIRRIGEGGMGVVYEALRLDSPTGDRVAIKLVRRGMDTEYILRRFRKERQILATLDHPNIAKLLDGGISDDGLPYFVMEFIDGEMVDDYCRSHSLETRQRVELIREVCGALAYAHAQHVIHRDIKPGNIMVDSSGTPKLLDFGIAKLLATEDGQISQRTVTELRIITPDYASPEQIRGDVATERCDVYALGVVLSELVSGRQPRTLTQTSATQGRARDLQLVIYKSTHQDPSRRYPSMREFADDLSRLLIAQSVLARPDGFFYRLSQTLQRRSKFAWAASTVAVAFIAAFLSWFVQRPTGFHSSARRSVAILDFQNVTGAPATAWFSTALTEMLNAEISAGEKIRAIPGDSVARMESDIGLRSAGSYSPETLHRIVANAHPDYVVAGSYVAAGGQPDVLVRVDIRLQDAKTAESLLSFSDTGTPAEFPAIATRAGAKLRQTLGVSAKSAVPLRNFANTETARLYAEGLAHIRNFDPLAARALLERAIAESPSDPLSHAALASALARLGYENRAAEEAKCALDLSGRLPAPQRLEVEARYYSLRRDWSKAAAIYQKLWSEFPDNLDYGIDMANAQTNGGNVPAARKTIAQLRRSPSASADARVDLAEALAAEVAGEPRLELAFAQRAASKARQAGATQALAEALYYEGWARWLLADLKGAEQVYSEALSLFTAAGNQHRVVNVRTGLATVLLDEGRTAESAQMQEEGLAIARKIGNRSLEATVNNNLARCWEEMGALTKAQLAYQQTTRIDEELNDRFNLATGQLNIGGVLKDEGHLPDAERQITQALDTARAIGKKSTIAMALSTLGEEKQAVGELSQAWRLQSEALAVARDIGRKTTVAAALSGQAAILRSQAKWRDAEAKYDEANTVAADAPEKLASIRLDQAQLFADQAKLEPAARLARDALNEFKKENNPQQEACAEAILAQIYARQHDAVSARQLSQSARQHLGDSEVLAARLQVAEAGAFAAAAMQKTIEARRILKELLAEANKTGLQETAWEAELLMAELDPTPRAEARVQQIRREAAAREMFRIAQFRAPRLI
jgi:serine/threonine protein kinase